MNIIFSLIYSSIFFIFTLGCQTTAYQSPESEYNRQLSRTIEKSCFNGTGGSFFAYVTTPDSPTLSWEGKWTQNFSKIKTQIIDPSGAVFDYNPLEEIEKKFGAKGLRSIMCGQTAFLPYIQIDRHKIKIKGGINSTPASKTQTMLETKSEFYYGLFGTKNKNSLLWNGFMEKQKTIPKSIHFGSGDDFIEIEFIDYE